MTDTRQRPKRLLALDILRGITIAGMILVNNPGSWGHIYAPLQHAPWNGLTPTDLVFPFFMFIMGVSTYMSLRKYDFRLSGAAAWKILRRTVVIFLIGIGIAWFGLTLRRIAGGKPVVEAMINFDNIRMLGVMPRLALCYGAGSLLALSMSRKALAWCVASLLAVYAAVLLLGNGLVFSADNVIAIVDRAVLGSDHMYSDTIDGITLKFDPEGLLSTLPSIAHMLIGFLCGSLIMQTTDNRERILRLFIGIIDIRGHRRWCRFFEAFGVNPLFMYCLGAVLSILMGFIRVPYAAAEAGVISLKGWLYQAVCMPVAAGDATLASFIFAVAFVLLNWCVGYVLYKKKIYIKI